MKRIKNDSAKCSCSTCSICMNEMSEFTFQLPCEHVFHSVCLLNWISKEKTTCPLCRQEFMPRKFERDSGAGVFNGNGAGVLNRAGISNTQRVLELQHYRNASNMLQNNHLLQIRNEGRQRREHRSRRIFRPTTNNHRNTNVFSLVFRKFMVYFIRPQTANVS